MAILEILSKKEIKCFDFPPVFDREERKYYFNMSKGAQEYFDNIRSPEFKVGFIVQYGYFYATRKFYSPETFYKTDISHVLSLLGLDIIFNVECYQKNTRKKHRSFILENFAWNEFSNSEKLNLT